MKNFLLILLCLPLIGLGQDIKYTIYSGVNYSNPFGEGIEYIKEYYELLEENSPLQGSPNTAVVNGRIGLNIGLNIDYNIIENLSLSSGLSYSEKGMNMKSEMFNLDWLTDNTGQIVGEFIIKGNTSVNTKMNYINVPILIKYNTTKGFYIGGGLNISFLINESVNLISSSVVIDDTSNTGDISDIENYMLQNNIDIDSDWDSYFGYKDPEGMVIGTQLVLGYNINRYDLSFRINSSGNFAKTDRYYENNGFGNEYSALKDYNPELIKHLTLQLCIGYTL
jgi:hypothetical protein